MSIAEQRRDPAEGRAVADARRHRDHRAVDQAADDRRQRALHAGDDDQTARLAESRVAREQPVDAGDADVVQRSTWLP